MGAGAGKEKLVKNKSASGSTEFPESTAAGTIQIDWHHPKRCEFSGHKAENEYYYFIYNCDAADL